MRSTIQSMLGMIPTGRGSAAIAAALIMAFLPITLGGCSDEGPAAPGAAETPVSWASLISGTHLVDGINSPLEFEYAIDSTYVYRFLYQPPRIEEGHVIIGAADGGYIRRVTRVSVSGDRLILETTGARLADAVRRGETAFSIPIGFGSTAAGAAIDAERQPATPDYFRCAEGALPSGGGIDFSGLMLFEQEISGSPASIRITSGYIEFNPTVHIGFTISDGGARRVEWRVEGLCRSDLDISVDIPEPMELRGGLPLASARRRIVHYMGIVPIVAVVELDFALSYGFSGAYSGACNARFRNSIDLTLDALCEFGSWVDVSKLEPEMSAAPLSCAEYSNAHMRISIEPRITVTLYGAPFSSAAFDIEGAFTVASSTPPVWEWSMSGELEGRCGVDPSILAPEPAEYETEPLIHQAPLGSGPYTTDSYIFVLAWGNEGTGDYQFAYPRGVAVDASGDIYVVDSWNNRVQKFAPDSTFIMKWGAEGSGEGQFLFPADAAVDAAGNIYVTDSGNDRVQKFGPDAAFITAWGTSGTGPGEFNEPGGIAVGPSGDLYVVDCGNNRVQRFTQDGLFIAEWGGYGTAPGMFDRPVGIAADGAGNIYVTECRNHRVQKFTAAGDVLALWGSVGAGEGEFECPTDVVVDGEGLVYIIDYGNDRLQILGPDGLFIEEIGGPGTGEGQFDRPEGVALGPGGVLYILDSRNERVQKFAPRNP